MRVLKAIQYATMKNKNEQFRLFFEGKLSKYEAREFVDWLSSSDGEEFLQTEIIKEWLKDGEGEKWDSAPTWSGIKAKAENQRFLIEAENKNAVQKPDHKIVKRYWQFGENSIFMRLSIAAAITLLIVCSVVYQNFFVSPTVESVESLATVNKSTAAGQRLRFYLPDSTLVFLNAESKIEFTENFAGGRNVHLSGEGFFEVAHDSLRPFTVHANGLGITALGTSFNVKAFPNEEETSVALLTGKVIIDDDDSKRSVFLTPGQQAKVSINQTGITKSAIENPEVLNWRKGILHFKQNSLKEVTYALERWYGVEIDINGEGKSLTFNGSFDDENLQNVLELLSLSGGFEFKIEKKKVTIDLRKDQGR